MNDSGPKLMVERLISAPARIVFDAWLDREALRQFMCPTPGSHVSRVECDPRVAPKADGRTSGAVLAYHDRIVGRRSHSP